jgi:DNA-binding IclR family transcriptional regulator
MTTTQAPYPGTQAVLRAVALLKAFSDAHPELTLTELARAVGLNKTTAYRMLTALESEGMVLRNPQTNNYRLGPGTIELGGRALRANDMRAISREELAALANRTGETATLETLVGDQVLILDEASGHYRLGATHSIGTSWPVHATSTGKAIMAFLPERRRKALVKGPLAAVTPKTIIDRLQLEDELAAIREAGYAVAMDEIEMGYAALAAPVLNYDREPVASIGVGGPSSRMPAEVFEKLAPLVVEAAARISERLGYRPQQP